MTKRLKFCVLIFLFIYLTLVVVVGIEPPGSEPEVFEPPAPAPIEAIEPPVPSPTEISEQPISTPTDVPEIDTSGFDGWKIVDKRVDKTPLNGKYLLDNGSWYPDNDDWTKQFYFEIFDDYILTSEAITRYKGIVEIDQFEDLTWICFIESNDHEVFDSLNFYLYAPGIFIQETYASDLFNEHSNVDLLTYKKEELLLEEIQIQEASDSEKDLLDFDPSTFYLDKTFGDIRNMYIDLQFCWYETGSLVYHSEKAEKFFRIVWIDDPPDDTEIFGFGSSAKNIFPNMGSWVFKEEVYRIADKYSERQDELFFTYKGYLFRCSYGESFDITPNTLVMVNKIRDENE